MQQPLTMNKNLIKKRHILIPTSLGLLLLSGCLESDLNALIHKSDHPSDTNYCQLQSAPFKHTLCQVTQASLQQPDASVSLRLFWKSGQWQSKTNRPDLDPSRPPLYTFDALLSDLPDSSELKFAINAGMYNDEFAPIGYTVIEGEQILSLNLNKGAGNFHLLPNGVLWWDKDNHIQITESQQFAQQQSNRQISPWYATQSGPMLVIDNQLHPKFNKNSTSKKIRNGVGVCSNGQVQFVTSHEPINFYQFASYFQQQLHCPNALFLDGGIASALYAPELNHKDDKNMAVMLGLIEDSPH